MCGRTDNGMDLKVVELERIIMRNSAKIIIEHLLSFKICILSTINQSVMQYLHAYYNDTTPLLDISKQFITHIKSDCTHVKENISRILSTANPSLHRKKIKAQEKENAKECNNTKVSQIENPLLVPKGPTIHWITNKILYTTQNFNQIQAYDVRSIPYQCKSIFIHDKIYFTGGIGGNGVCSAVTIEFNCATLKFSQRSDMIYPRMHHSNCSALDYLFAITGCISNCASLLRTCERYSFSKNQWEELPHSLHARCCSACLTVNNNTIYNIGGFLENGPSNEIEYLNLQKPSMWVALKTSGNPPIYNCTGLQIPDGRILIIGGLVNDRVTNECNTLSFVGKKCLLDLNSTLLESTHFGSSPSPVIRDECVYCIDRNQSVVKYSISKGSWFNWMKPDLTSILVRLTPILK